MFQTSLSTNADSTAQSDTVYGYGIITYADSFLMLGRRTGVGKAKFCVVINGNNNQKILNRYQDVIVAGTAAFNEDVTFYLAASFSGTTSFYGVSSHYGNDRFYTAPLLDSGFVIRHDGSTVLEVGTGQWTNGHIYTLFDAVGSSSDKIIVFKARGGYTPTDAQMDNYGIFLEASAVHVGGSLYVATEVSGQTVTQRSDERLKNIRPYESAYDDVLDDLEPITFTWKENDSQEHIGLGARKTSAILDRHGLDDAALSHDLGGDYVINYNELTVMLLKRVQDLTKRVEELEAQLCR
jgi:hypothetical protein